MTMIVKGWTGVEQSTLASLVAGTWQYVDLDPLPFTDVVTLARVRAREHAGAEVLIMNRGRCVVKIVHRNEKDLVIRI